MITEILNHKEQEIPRLFLISIWSSGTWRLWTTVGTADAKQMPGDETVRHHSTREKDHEQPCFINDLTESTDLDREATAEVRGGFILFGFPSWSTSTASVKFVAFGGVDGESTDEKHGTWQSGLCCFRPTRI